jgi:NAD(P)-dependent dehydrogenase (short-subunit alcohol dehydrogenase family)
MLPQRDFSVQGIDGRVALVTGAQGVIGREIAEELERQGAKVCAADLSAPSGVGMLSLPMDVTSEESVDDACARVEAELGPIDILVNAAGIFRIESIASMSRQTWDQIIAVNLTGFFLTARRVLPGMSDRRYGRVTEIGSSAGKTGGALNVGAYAAAKAGAMALTKSLAKEYAPNGVTVNALAPAMIDTPMIDDMRQLVDRIPVGRLGTAQDIAAVVCFLSSQQGSFITGEIVDVNGGFLID